MRRQGGNPWNPKTYLSNDVINAWLITVVLWGVLIAVFGPALIPFLIVQAVFGFSLLESVNYLEHYGLLRHKNDNGRYERCTPEHSWNSDHIVTNLLPVPLSGTVTTTPTRLGATRRCAAWTGRRTYRAVTRR